MPRKSPIYRIRFMSEGRVIEIYAESVGHADMFGFIQIEGIVWGKRSEVIVDPTEDELKNEFAGVKRTFVPLHAVVRIDEVEKSGPAKIVPLPGGSGKADSPPVPIYTPSGKPGKAD
ncbi:MAG: DUF1820 family protein [Candidatus Binatia bacterium]